MYFCYVGEHILKIHNKTLLLYHLVFPLKYRRKAISKEVGETLKQVCFEISERYEIQFVEIGYETDQIMSSIALFLSVCCGYWLVKCLSCDVEPCA